jgi:hypothetical protein
VLHWSQCQLRKKGKKSADAADNPLHATILGRCCNSTVGGGGGRGGSARGGGGGGGSVGGARVSSAAAALLASAGVSASVSSEGGGALLESSSAGDGDGNHGNDPVVLANGDSPMTSSAPSPNTTSHDTVPSEGGGGLDSAVRGVGVGVTMATAPSPLTWRERADLRAMQESTVRDTHPMTSLHYHVTLIP